MHSKTVSLYLALIFLASFLLITGCKKAIVGTDEAGILLNKKGNLTVFNSGESRYYSPFFQQFYLISIKPTVVSYISEEGLRIAESKNGDVIESQLSYIIADVPKAVHSFGAAELHNHIRNAIRTKLAMITKELITDAALLEDPGKRVPITAQIHFDLNSSLADQGIEIIGIQLRVR